MLESISWLLLFGVGCGLVALLLSQRDRRRSLLSNNLITQWKSTAADHPKPSLDLVHTHTEGTSRSGRHRERTCTEAVDRRRPEIGFLET